MKRREFLTTTLGLTVLPILLPNPNELSVLTKTPPPIPTLFELFGFEMDAEMEAIFQKRVRVFDGWSTKKQKRYIGLFNNVVYEGDQEIVSCVKDSVRRLADFYKSRIVEVV